MVALRAPSISIPPTAPDDLRIGQLLARELGAGDEARVALVGFPSDEGVRRNGGRTGAAQGPAAIRQWLYRLPPDARAPERFAQLVGHMRDLGDLETTGELDRDQEALGELLAPLLAARTFVIVLGGGHETTFGHFLGYARAEQDVAILNWDAHADVREPKDGQGHSGSPFRQALEHQSGRCRSYTVAGLLPHAVAEAHANWVEATGGAVWWNDLLDEERVRAIYSGRTGNALVSFDLDALDNAFAPGVSAPAVGGMQPPLWFLAAYLAGVTHAVTSADVVELSPPLDRDSQTAKLAAVTVWHILRGLATR
jgi:formiminoglutamase